MENTALTPNIIHVNNTGDDSNEGTDLSPFRTISRAAHLAQPGDTVIVHGGTYRESINPARGGTNKLERITYRAALGEHPTIKGSESISGWEKLETGIWHVCISNSLFGDFNPFAERLCGDWLEQPEWEMSLGNVYLNGNALCQAQTVRQWRTQIP